jgi:hypothetical protein
MVPIHTSRMGCSSHINSQIELVKDHCIQQWVLADNKLGIFKTSFNPHRDGDADEKNARSTVQAFGDTQSSGKASSCWV